MKSLIESDKLFIENGPTNIIAEAFSSEKMEIYDLICKYSSKFLKDLSLEIETLKKPTSQKNKFVTDIAKTMFESTQLFLPNFITPMASVAGSISELLLLKVLEKFDVNKIYINNGGDISLYITKNEKFNFSVGGETNFVVEYYDTDGFGGIATSGWKGRSFSMGVADSVTVIAEKASIADAAATIICNHIDLENSKKVKKTIANNLYEDTDLNNKLITVSVESLTDAEIRQALSRGKIISENYISKNLIKSVIINLQDNVLILGHKFKIKFNKKIKIIEVWNKIDVNSSIINNVVDSFIAFLFAISGPVAIMLSITSANNIDPKNVSIWLFGCFAVNGFLSIIITLKNKQPLVLMWSIPGMILIGYSLKNYSLNDIVGVYLTSSFLLFLISFTNIINFLKKNIPTEIVMGMVSAIFLSFCVDWVNSLNTYPMLASIMSLTFFVLLSLSKKV